MVRQPSQAQPTKNDSGAHVKVLYVIGAGRSGSTLLGNILGQIDGVFHAGELVRMWKYGVARDTRCGCGARLRSCRVWRQILNDAAPGVLDDAARVLELAFLQRKATRTRHVLRVSAGRPVAPRDVRRYAQLMERVYHAIARSTRSSVVIDSSKRPTPGALLQLMPSISPFYIHLVRDGRAEAFSWTRARPFPGEPGGKLQRVPTLRAAGAWVVYNELAEWVRGRGPSIRVRYEDLCARPRDFVDHIVAAAKLPGSCSAFVDGGVVLALNHGIGGNPSKRNVGFVPVRLDDEWVRVQRASDRAKVTALAAPLLHRYGYPMIVGARGVVAAERAM
jgi:Sulfotransferase family